MADSKNNQPLEYEARVLNALTEPVAKNRALRKLREYLDSRGWVYSEETKKYNEVPDEEDFERDIFLDLLDRFVAIIASDKKGVAGSVPDLLKLAETDDKGFTALYEKAVEANPGFAPKNDPNE